MIYLASPYTHDDPFVQEQRYISTMKALSQMISRGLVVYSPIVHCHELAKVARFPGHVDFWHRYNCGFIRIAEAVHVLRLDDWQESRGVQHEIAYANELKIPVVYI